jgi:hypothetical protein
MSDEIALLLHGANHLLREEVHRHAHRIHATRNTCHRTDTSHSRDRSMLTELLTSRILSFKLSSALFLSLSESDI